MTHSTLTGRIAATRLCSFLIAGLASSPSWAHPGHGVDGGDWSLHHYLTEPEHLVGLPPSLHLLHAPMICASVVRYCSSTSRWPSTSCCSLTFFLPMHFVLPIFCSGRGWQIE